MGSPGSTSSRTGEATVNCFTRYKMLFEGRKSHLFSDGAYVIRINGISDKLLELGELC
jgi:hypothetical protein